MDYESSIHFETWLPRKKKYTGMCLRAPGIIH